jgi:hypothetical protein
MTYRGIVKGKVIECEGSMSLPDGTSVRIIPEPLETNNNDRAFLALKEWLQEARLVRSQLPTTTDSGALLRQLREERARR